MIYLHIHDLIFWGLSRFDSAVNRGRVVIE